MHLCLFGVFFLLLRRPPRSTPTAHSFPTRRSSDLVWPGSIWRDSTTPPTGERIAAFRRLVSSDESWARACATLATAESTLALARASAATAASISVLAGTLPPDSRDTSRSRDREACDSASEDLGCTTCRRERNR